MDQVVEICLRTRGDEHKRSLDARSGLADVIMEQGDLSAAEAMHTDILETRRRVLGDKHRHTIRSLRSLALVLMKREKFSEAEKLMREAVRLAKIMHSEESLYRFLYSKDFGRSLLANEKYDEAEAHLMHAYEGYKAKLGDEHTFTQDTVELLIDLYKAWGKPDQAAEYRAKLVDEVK
jgi:tetratricopeptide (TPR) repeat protein